MNFNDVALDSNGCNDDNDEENVNAVLAAIALFPGAAAAQQDLLKPVHSQTWAEAADFSVTQLRFWCHLVSALLRLLSGLAALIISTVVLHETDMPLDGLRKELRWSLHVGQLLASLGFGLPAIGSGGLSLRFLQAMTRSKKPEEYAGRYAFETALVRVTLVLSLGHAMWSFVAGRLLIDNFCEQRAFEPSADVCSEGRYVLYSMAISGCCALGSVFTFLSHTGVTFLVYNSLAVLRALCSWVALLCAFYVALTCRTVHRHGGGGQSSSMQVADQVRLLVDLSWGYGSPLGVCGLLGACASLVAGWTRSQIHATVCAYADVLVLAATVAFGSAATWLLNIESHLRDVSVWTDYGGDCRGWLIGMVAAAATLCLLTVASLVVATQALLVPRCTPREWTVVTRVTLAEARRQTNTDLLRRLSKQKTALQQCVSDERGEKLGTVAVRMA